MIVEIKLLRVALINVKSAAVAEALVNGAAGTAEVELIMVDLKLAVATKRGTQVPSPLASIIVKEAFALTKLRFADPVGIKVLNTTGTL